MANKKPNVSVAPRTTRSSTTRSSKTSSAITSSTKSSGSIRGAKTSKVTSAKSRVTSSSSEAVSKGLIGPRAAAYLLAEEKRKKAIRQKAKAVKASEEDDFSDEEAIATSPPVTSDVEADVEEVDADEEEFNNIYGNENIPENDDALEEHLEEDLVDNPGLDSFQDMEVDVEAPSNGIDVVKTPVTTSSPFSIPSKRPSPDKRKVYKVTSNMFSPRTRKLAVAGKRQARRVSTIEDAFPADKYAFFLDVARHTATVESLVDVFEYVLEDTDVQKLLTSFMGYARGGLFTSLAKKAREFTASYYTLPGKTSAEDFFKEFELLVKEAGYDKDDDYVLEIAEGAVDPSIMTSLIQNRTEDFSSYKELKKLVTGADNLRRRWAEQKRGYGYFGWNTNPQGQNRGQSSIQQQFGSIP
ncbi:hypothetical protein EV360DRAFT_87870 [Lentinula raphanica]|nr:hypothetical protein EV360DRAFT_87870 [Lentinula raphanica]